MIKLYSQYCDYDTDYSSNYAAIYDIDLDIVDDSSANWGELEELDDQIECPAPEEAEC